MPEPIDEEIEGPSRGAGKGLPAFWSPRSRRAFTLVEAVVVLSLMAALSLTDRKSVV